MTDTFPSFTKTTDLHRQFADFFPERQLRPMVYFLSKRLMDGHICVLESELSEDKDVIRQFGEIEIPDWRKLTTWVGRPEDEPRPFVRTTDGRWYFQRYYRYETIIVDRLRDMVVSGNERRAQRIRELEAQLPLVRSLTTTLPVLSEVSGAEVVDWQLIGALQCLLSDFSILTGGPGTGKTRTLAKLLSICFAVNPQIRVRLAAPTGKAAMRMLESLRDSASAMPEQVRDQIMALESSTLHLLLGFRMHDIRGKYNSANPLDYDLVVVDEASMVDIPMMARLLDALKPGCRLVLLGDRNQLASVDAGSLMGDLCRSVEPVNGFAGEHADWLNKFIGDPGRTIPADMKGTVGNSLLADCLIELQYSHRFRELGQIGRLARAVIGNNQEMIKSVMNEPPNKVLRFCGNKFDEAIREFAEGYAEFIQEQNIAEALKKFNRLRILTTLREGPLGLYTVNRKVEEYMSSKKLLKITGLFYHNRPVMVTRNNRERDLYNGDVGIVRREGDSYRVWFPSDDPENPRSILPAYLNHAETTFAMTIHKSQGSEFDRVMVILPEDSGNPLLTRELLYTGITRARNEAVILGSSDIILQSSERTVKRVSAIRERLNIHI